MGITVLLKLNLCLLLIFIFPFFLLNSYFYSTHPADATTFTVTKKEIQKVRVMVLKEFDRSSEFGVNLGVMSIL